MLCQVGLDCCTVSGTSKPFLLLVNRIQVVYIGLTQLCTSLLTASAETGHVAGCVHCIQTSGLLSVPVVFQRFGPMLKGRCWSTARSHTNFLGCMWLGNILLKNHSCLGQHGLFFWTDSWMHSFHREECRRRVMAQRLVWQNPRGGEIF
jgi:hypothetical protein